MKSCYELFGIECSKGWKDIVQPLIQECNERGIEIHQIKEKFGTLRFYTGPAPEDFFAKVLEAEKKSAETCETCGKPGYVGPWEEDGYWLVCACDTCRRKHNEQ